MSKEMDKLDRVVYIIAIMVAVAFIGLFIWAGVSNIRSNTELCVTQAGVVGVEARYKDGQCQFQSNAGVWLNESDYLLLCVSSKCP